MGSETPWSRFWGGDPLRLRLDRAEVLLTITRVLLARLELAAKPAILRRQGAGHHTRTERQWREFIISRRRSALNNGRMCCQISAVRIRLQVRQVSSAVKDVDAEVLCRRSVDACQTNPVTPSLCMNIARCKCLIANLNRLLAN